MSNLCYRIDLGRRDYRETWALQTELVGRRQAGTIPDVIRLLAKRGLHGVPVVDEKGELVGTLSELDIVHRAFPDYVHADSALLQGLSRADVLKLRSLDTLTVSSFMTKTVCTVTPDDDLIEAARLMVERRLNRLPVIEGKQVVGMLSRHDVLRGMLELISGLVEQPRE